MSFDKKYIRKDYIINSLFNTNNNILQLSREYKIESLFNAELLIMDTWSSKFYDDLDIKEREIRKCLDFEYGVYSTDTFTLDERYKNLKSFSETLVSLAKDPSWIDIRFTIDKLHIYVEEEERGKFDILKKKCIDAIINYFD